MSVTGRHAALAWLFVAGHAGAAGRATNDDQGQGSVEYVGIVLAVAAIAAAVIFVVGTNGYLGIGDAIVNAVKRAIESLT